MSARREPWQGSPFNLAHPSKKYLSIQILRCWNPWLPVRKTTLPFFNLDRMINGIAPWFTDPCYQLLRLGHVQVDIWHIPCAGTVENHSRITLPRTFGDDGGNCGTFETECAIYCDKHQHQKHDVNNNIIWYQVANMLDTPTNSKKIGVYNVLYHVSLCLCICTKSPYRFGTLRCVNFSSKNQFVLEWFPMTIWDGICIDFQLHPSSWAKQTAT